MIHPAQKQPKARCEYEEEESGGSHSWYTRCDRAAGHEGPHRFHLSFKDRLVEGTSVHRVEDEIKMRRERIAEHHDNIGKLEREIQSLEERGEP